MIAGSIVFTDLRRELTLSSQRALYLDRRSPLTTATRPHITRHHRARPPPRSRSRAAAKRQASTYAIAANAGIQSAAWSPAPPWLRQTPGPLFRYTTPRRAFRPERRPFGPAKVKAVSRSLV